MLDLGVNIDDYRHGNVDMMSASDMQNLQKALQATDVRGGDPTGTSGAPLKVESLENVLKILTLKESDIQFWKRIPKLPAFNTVEEYNQLVSYGADRGGAYNEGELPEEEDSVYKRKSQLVKFYGITKSVTHPMTLVNTNVGNLIQRETQNGTLWILRKVDRSIVTANSDIIPQEVNGLYKQHFDGHEATLDQYHSSEVVVDLRGKALTEDSIESAALGIIENFGYGNLMVAPPTVLSGFVKRFHESKLIQPNSPAVTAGVMGQRVKTFASQFGDIELMYDKFIKNNPPRQISSTKLSAKAPDAIVPDGSTPVAVVSDALTKFADGAGDYFYAVAPVNRYGEGALTLLSNTAISVSTTQSVVLKFADGGGNFPATGYVIYRSVKNAPNSPSTIRFYPIFSISSAQLTTGYDTVSPAVNTIGDRNRYLSNTESAFLIQGDEEVMSFKQLAPLMKMDLATLSPATRFMILLYGTPQLYAPKKMTRFINIGQDYTA
jgi:hypothetical protein